MTCAGERCMMLVECVVLNNYAALPVDSMSSQWACTLKVRSSGQVHLVRCNPLSRHGPLVATYSRNTATVNSLSFSYSIEQPRLLRSALTAQLIQYTMTGTRNSCRRYRPHWLAAASRQKSSLCRASNETGLSTNRQRHGYRQNV